MTSDRSPTQSEAPPPETPPARSWLRWGVPTGALASGVLAGAALGLLLAQADPTESDQYRALEDEMSAAQAHAQEMEDHANEVDAWADEVEATLEQAKVDLGAWEAELKAREEAVSATEQRIAETSIEQGIWTVGVDVQPGTYRTAKALTGDCYWSITATGTNGSDIIENDIPSGGYPTVTLREGQDFENNGCGTFVKN